jgi:hypothetical protein
MSKWVKVGTVGANEEAPAPSHQVMDVFIDLDETSGEHDPALRFEFTGGRTLDFSINEVEELEAALDDARTTLMKAVLKRDYGIDLDLGRVAV